MAATANVALATDTFNTWLTKTNEIIYKVNGITKSANTIQANTSTIVNEGSFGGLLTLSGGIVAGGLVANVTSGTLNVTANTTLSSNTNVTGKLLATGSIQLFGANTNVSGGTLLVQSNTNFVSANTDIHGGKLLVTANTNFTQTPTVNGTVVATGDPASDALAFAIALG